MKTIYLNEDLHPLLEMTSEVMAVLNRQTELNNRMIALYKSHLLKEVQMRYPEVSIENWAWFIDHNAKTAQQIEEEEKDENNLGVFIMNFMKDLMEFGSLSGADRAKAQIIYDTLWREFNGV